MVQGERFHQLFIHTIELVSVVPEVFIGSNPEVAGPLSLEFPSYSRCLSSFSINNSGLETPKETLEKRFDILTELLLNATKITTSDADSGKFEFMYCAFIASDVLI